MEIKGQTIFVVIIEGAYPGNASLPELFANEADANTRKVEMEAFRYKNDNRQHFWCEVEEITIQ